MSRCSAFDWPHLLPATSCDLKLCLTPQEAGQQQPLFCVPACCESLQCSWPGRLATQLSVNFCNSSGWVQWIIDSLQVILCGHCLALPSQQRHARQPLCLSSAIVCERQTCLLMLGLASFDAAQDIHMATCPP